MTDGGGLTAGAVARRLGVAVTTLRTWHQRYGLGPSLHEPGHHRRYTGEDIARLELMQRLVGEGVSPGEAARWAARSPLVPAAGSGPQNTGRDGGGLALGRSASAARGLSRAALRLDAPAVRQRVAEAVADLGVIAAWDTVLRPVLFAIGERYAATGGYVEVEHLLSGCVSAVFSAVPRPPVDVPARILLACADEEQHSLPVEALAAALAADGIASRVLGARVPLAAMIAALRRTGPAGILVWSHHRATADPRLLSAIGDDPVRPLVLAAGGPGWDREVVPRNVALPESLADAVTLLAPVAA